jgi:hypothetical protein
VRADYEIPDVPGVANAWPAIDDWPGVVSANRERASTWDFAVAGIHVSELRSLGREETLLRGYECSQGAGIEVRRPRDASQPIVMTGHQPELYHCGVWVKQFAMERLAERVGASAVNIGVDSDAFDAVDFALPCPVAAAKCRYEIAPGGRDTCFACAPVPGAAAVREVFGRAEKDAGRLGGEIGARVGLFAEALVSGVESSASLGEALTKARRLHEGAATGYLELPISVLAAGDAFLAFATDLIENAERFVDIHNAELRKYRAERRLRSAAQPFPDLRRDPSFVELPLWVLGEGRRPLGVRISGSQRLLVAGDEALLDLSARSDVAESLRGSGLTLAPKALALTAFTRAFCSDVLIHGLGGARYDEVTDRVFAGYYGVEPLDFVAITLTMRLPVAAAEVTEDDLSALRARINRLDHNPDEVLADVELPGHERQRASDLAAEKSDLTKRISEPGADKKLLGVRIREVNAALSELVEPVRLGLVADLERAERERAEVAVMESRDYPYFLWAANDVAATIR